MFDKFIRLSIGNPVFVNLLFMVVVVAGIVSAVGLPVEQFPDVSLDKVFVRTLYPGASASDVEELVTRPIEDALDDVDDVHEVVSTSQEGRSMVTVTFNAGTDLQVARSDVEKAVSTVDDLPEDSETPLVREMEFTLPVVSVALLHATTG